MHLVFGQLELARADVFVGKEFDFLEADHLRAHQNVAVRAIRGRGEMRFLADFEHTHLGVADGVSEVVHVHALHVGLALVEVQPLDVVLLSLVEINCFGMDGGERAGEIYLTDYLRLVRDVDDDEVVGSDRAQADGIGRIGFLRPVPMVSGAVEESSLGEPLAELPQAHVAEFFFRGKRQLEGSALEVVDQDFQIIRLDEGVLGRAAEEIVRMLDDKLVERRGTGHQHRAGAAAAAPGAARALPSGRDRARIACHHCRVKRADIDAELERVG